MESSNKTILVPWDFTNVAEFALQHSIRAAKVIGCSVTMLHVTKKEKENKEAEEKLESISQESEKRFGLKPEYLAVEGSIFNTISDVATKKDAIFVVMGTHGMKGMQKITGSWALKVIASSKIPFIVVQKPPKDEQLANIIYPVDYKLEDKQKSVWALYLNKYFKSKLLIFSQQSNDATLSKRIKANLLFTKKMFDNQGIEYEEFKAPDNKDFSESTIEFAQEHNANAILITTTKNPELKDYMFGATEQKIIANKHEIAVMCVNPKEGKLQLFA